jgi:hypothetical protein
MALPQKIENKLVFGRRPGAGRPFDASWPSEKSWTTAGIEPIEVFYYYDGPLIFSAVVGPFVMLFAKWDELDDNSLYTASIVDEAMLAALGECRLSVFGCVAYDLRFMVELDGMVPTRFWRIGVGNVPAKTLAERGAACAPGHPKLPDVLPGYPVPDWERRQVRHLVRGSSYDVFAEAAGV